MSRLKLNMNVITINWMLFNFLRRIEMIAGLICLRGVGLAFGLSSLV